MENVSSKSRTATFLLALFLGPMGIHRFYVGKTGTGVIMLLLGFSIIGTIPALIWTWVDIAILLVGGFKDKEGRIVATW